MCHLASNIIKGTVAQGNATTLRGKMGMVALAPLHFGHVERVEGLQVTGRLRTILSNSNDVWPRMCVVNNGPFCRVSILVVMRKPHGRRPTRANYRRTRGTQRVGSKPHSDVYGSPPAGCSGVTYARSCTCRFSSFFRSSVLSGTATPDVRF